MYRSFLPLLCLALIACNDEADKAAGLMCDCGKSLAGRMSAQTKNVLKKAAESKSPAQSLEGDVERLGDEEENAVRLEMAQIGSAAENGTLGRCDASVENLRVRGKTEADRQKRVLELMLKKPDCEVMSGIWALGVEAKSKGVQP